MALDAAVLAEVRSWVGSSPSDEDLALRHERLGSAHAVALEVLRGRQAEFLASPATFSVDGDYGQGTAVNITELRRQIAQLEQLVANDGQVAVGVVSTAQLVREGRER